MDSVAPLYHLLLSESNNKIDEYNDIYNIHFNWLNDTYTSTYNTLYNKFIFKAPNTIHITKRTKKKIDILNNVPIFQTPLSIRTIERSSFIPGEKKLNFDINNENNSIASNIKRSLRSTSKLSISSMQSDVLSITSTLENKLSMVSPAISPSDNKRKSDEMSFVEEQEEPVKKKKGGKKAAKRTSNESIMSEMEATSARSTRSNAADIISKPAEAETKRTLRNKKEIVLESVPVEAPKKASKGKNAKAPVEIMSEIDTSAKQAANVELFMQSISNIDMNEELPSPGPSVSMRNSNQSVVDKFSDIDSDYSTTSTANTKKKTGKPKKITVTEVVTTQSQRSLRSKDKGVTKELPLPAVAVTKEVKNKKEKEIVATAVTVVDKQISPVKVLEPVVAALQESMDAPLETIFGNAVNSLPVPVAERVTTSSSSILSAEMSDHRSSILSIATQAPVIAPVKKLVHTKMNLKAPSSTVPIPTLSAATSLFGSLGKNSKSDDFKSKQVSIASKLSKSLDDAEENDETFFDCEDISNKTVPEVKSVAATKENEAKAFAVAEASRIFTMEDAPSDVIVDKMVVEPLKIAENTTTFNEPVLEIAMEIEEPEKVEAQVPVIALEQFIEAQDKQLNISIEDDDSKAALSAPTSLEYSPKMANSVSVSLESIDLGITSETNFSNVDLSSKHVDENSKILNMSSASSFLAKKVLIADKPVSKPYIDSIAKANEERKKQEQREKEIKERRIAMLKRIEESKLQQKANPPPVQPLVLKERVVEEKKSVAIVPPKVAVPVKKLESSKPVSMANVPGEIKKPTTNAQDANRPVLLPISDNVKPATVKNMLGGALSNFASKIIEPYINGAKQLLQPKPATSSQPVSIAQSQSVSIPNHTIPVNKISKAKIVSIPIADYKSSDEESEDDKQYEVPDWASRSEIEKHLESQDLIDPDHIFPPNKNGSTCDLDGFKKTKRFHHRTSSGNWLKDRFE